MISIIVPVYNVEQYIKQCIESILTQTFSDWELILIDDGSTDSSGIICDNFVSSDKRIRCIHKNNEGVTEARRRGWEMSIGEWISFVDGDDTLPNNALVTLYEKTKTVDTDIVEGYSYFRDNLSHISSIEEYRHCLLKSVDLVSVSVWGKLFKREILNSWCFDIPKEIVRGEDWIMNIRIAFLSHKTPVLIPDKIYNYRDNKVSLSHIHRKNINYEYSFFQSWRDSIPYEKEKYYRYVVRIAVLMYVGVCVTDLDNVEVVDSPFATEIKQLVHKKAFRLKFHQKVLLQSKNRLLRNHIWKFHCLKERFFD
ncbi:MAG: glycosyltransferase family 2 protein [Prevotella sp.]|nr:glycosyltransferase family 2 protein [Prevotella sp.]